MTATLFERLAGGFGLIECEPEVTVERLLAAPWRGSTWRLVTKTDSVQRVEQFFSVLTWPATRYLVCSSANGWSCLANNRKGGSDVDRARFIAINTGVRAARIVNKPGRVRSYGERREVLQYEARIFELYEPDGTKAKAILAMDDGGRWTYHNSGPALPIEASFDSSARRKKDRFTVENFRQLCEHLSMPFVTAESLASQREYFLLAEILEPPEFRERTLRDAVTPEQDDDPAIGYLHRARTWMEHLDTHAESALIDLTRALELNPALEGEIRPLLERVRRKLEQADG